MGLRNAKAVTLRPSGLSDSYDGTNSFPGSMAQLRNLSIAYHTPNAFVPRPAATVVLSLPLIRDRFGISISDRSGSLLSGSGFGSTITCLLAIGNLIYGMANSVTYPGYDEPFCFNISTGAAIGFTNVLKALLPTSPSTSGDWTPPTMVAITPSLIMVTHPGYSGGSGAYLGWIDISSFTSSSMLATTTSGSRVLTGCVTTVGASAPILQGYIPGQIISGANIPAGTYVVSVRNGTFVLATTGSTTSGSPTVTALAATTGVVAGTLVAGPNFLTGTYVLSLSGTTATMSTNAIATGASTTVNFSGNGTVTMSANATGTSAAPETITVSGGTPTAPLWGAGNLNTNPLSIVPTCCYGFNGRAYFGAGPYLIFSDILNPLQVTLSSQALTIGDSSPVTALAGVPLTSQLTGGVQQSMTVFKGAGPLTQITGDSATSNLAQNAVVGSVGTLAPLSFSQTPLGLAFMAVDGLRILGLTGTLSEPIGSGGTGVNLPFLNALYPSRMCADYAENVYRITVQNAADPSLPFYEYWFDLNAKIWTGPHTCAASQVAQFPTGASFLIAPVQAPGQLWISDVLAKASSSFVENGVPLSWVYQTSLFPDNGEGGFNKVVQTSVSCALHLSDSVLASVVDDGGATLAAVSVTGNAGVPAQWSTSNWGGSVWGSQALKMREVPVKWQSPIMFRQAQFSFSGASSSGQVLGNLYAKMQPLNFNVPLS